MSENKIVYDLIIRAGDQETKIELGAQPNWATEHADLLKAADRLTLIPKPGQGLPCVAVRIPKGGRWIYFARTMAKLAMGAGVEVKIIIYALGWKVTEDTPDGPRARKQITWIYPNGVVEVTENEDKAEFGEELLNHVAAQAFAKIQQEAKEHGSDD